MDPTTVIILFIAVLIIAIVFGLRGGKEKPKEFPNKINYIAEGDSYGLVDSILKRLGLKAETEYTITKAEAIDAEIQVQKRLIDASIVFKTREKTEQIGELTVNAQYARAVVTAKNAAALEESSDRVLLTSNNHLSSLNEGAAGLGVLVEDYSMINRTRILAEIENATQYQAALNEIRASFIYEQEPKQLLHLQKDAIFGLYGERARLKDSDDPARDDKLKLLDIFISAEEKDFCEKAGADRLFQTETQEDVEGSDENPKPRRNGGQGLLPA